MLLSIKLNKTGAIAWRQQTGKKDSPPISPPAESLDITFTSSVLKPAYPVRSHIPPFAEFDHVVLLQRLNISGMLAALSP
jgi:hypothetical protein